MVRGFYYRLLILSLAILCACTAIVIVAILPSYLLSALKSRVAQARLEAQKAQPAPSFGDETLAVIKDLNKKLSIIENGQNNALNVSDKVIKAVILKKSSNIKITEISYQVSPGGGQISISGTAPSREELLSFRQALDDDPLFKNVDLPISNFVKGSDIQFSMSLAPAQQYAK